MTPLELYYGYARSSKLEQETSPVTQKEAILKWGLDNGVTIEHVFMENESATSVAYNQRPILVDLMTQLKAEDHLIVWRLDRLERRMLRLAELLGKLIEKGIHLHVLEDNGGQAQDFSSTMGRLSAVFKGAAAELYIEQFKDASIRGRLAAKKNGLASSGASPIGMRRVTEERNGTVVKLDVWDYDQIAIIEEIVLRHEAGESINSIARCFNECGLRKPNVGVGTSPGYWAKTKPSGLVDATGVAAAYNKATNLRSLGLRLGSEEAMQVWADTPTKRGAFNV